MTKIVHSLLAVAASSSVLLAQGGGWTGGPGKGLSFDGGDAFALKIASQLQTHFVFTALDSALGAASADTSSFTVRRARVALSGHAYKKNIHYNLNMDAADAGANSTIKDAWAAWNFMEGDNGTVGLRMGQGKTQFGLEGTGSSKGLFFVERSSAARGFSDARSRGAWVMGSHRENSLRWSFGAMNGASASGLGGGYVDAGEEAANSDNELSYVATVAFDPMGDTLGGKSNESRRQGDFRTDDRSLQGTVGLGIGLENGRNAAQTADIESTAVNVNTVWSVEGFQIMGEFFMRTDDLQGGAVDEEEATGFAVSGTWVMPKSGDSAIQWGFGARVNRHENDVGNNGTVNFLTGLRGIGAIPNADSTEISLVANAFYHDHSCKTQFEYTLQQLSATGASDADNHIFSIAFQILF